MTVRVKSLPEMTVSIMLVFTIVISIALAACVENRQITEQDRLASRNYFRLAVDFFHKGNVIETLKSLKEAERHNPEDKNVHNLYGLVYLGKKKFELSEKSFKRAIELDPKFSDSYVGLASVYMEKELWGKAIDQLKYPEQDLLYSRKDAVYDNLGWCHHKQGDDVKAIEYMIRATTENPKNCHAWYNMGNIYKDGAQHIDAMDAYEKATVICTDFLFGFYELAMAAIKAGDNEKARPALEKCISLGGDGIKASECKNLLRLLN